MKGHLHLKSHIWLVLIWMLVPVLAKADDEFKKTISKSFSATELNRLVLVNKFGDVDLITTETDVVKIDVTITVEADDENEAQEVFNSIKISLAQQGDQLKAETLINQRDNRTKFKINYKVKMPLKIETDITNRFGAIYANELIGFHDLKLAYGKLKVDRLINKKEMKRASIYLAYSDGTIGTSEWLSLDIKYSGLQINKSRALILNSRYSKVDVHQSSSIVAVSRYDRRYKIGSVNNIKISGAYSNYTIGELKNKLIVDIKYSDLDVKLVSNKFKEAVIDVKYGKVVFPINRTTPYYIDANAKYGKLIVPEDTKLSRHEETNYVELKGYVGGSETERKVVGSVKYGSLVFAY